MSTNVSLKHLPNETLAQVISHLRAFEVERLARTFNRRLFAICIPFLRDRIAARKNAREMIDLFSQPEYAEVSHHVQPQHEDCIDMASFFARYGLDTKYGPYSKPPSTPKMPFPNMDFMDLRNDLEWLHPLDKTMAAVAKQHPEWFNSGSNRPSAMTQEQIDDLVNSLKVPLPLSFVRFMTDVALQSRFPHADQSFEYRRPVKLKHDRMGIDGYAIPFYVDEADGIRYYLFVDAEGGEAIISAIWPWTTMYDPGDFERAQQKRARLALRNSKDVALDITPVGWRNMNGITLHATSFEDFLARLFYWSWACILCDYEDTSMVIPHSLEDYYFNVYTQLGRDQCA